MVEEQKRKIVLPPSSGQVTEEQEKLYSAVSIADVQFRETWSVWESLKYDGRDKSGQSSAFIDNNFELFEFNAMEGLAKIWRTKVGSIASLLSYEAKPRFKDSKDRFRTIEAICMFKKGIQPAWEDKMNAHGGEVQAQLDFYDGKIDVINHIFRDIVCLLLSEDYPFYEETNGVRVVDKSRDKPKIRFEVWVTFEDQPTKVNQIFAIFNQILQKHGQKVKLEFKNHKHH